MHRRTYMFALTVALTFLAAIGAVSVEKLKQFRYVGIHPIPKSQGGGVCHIMVPHVHVYAQADVKVQYRDHDGFKYFVGDPVAYGWDGEKHAFYGHHPIPVDVIVAGDEPDTEWCYIEGPHYHAWAPPAEAKLDLELRGDAYWYVGKFPKAYIDARPVYDPIDVVYQPIEYERPTVVVDVAPPGWYGLAIAAPVVEVHGAPVHVVAPVVVEAGVHVYVPPPPRIRVEVGLPSLEIGIGAHVHGGGGWGRGHGKHKGRKHW